MNNGYFWGVLIHHWNVFIGVLSVSTLIWVMFKSEVTLARRGVNLTGNTALEVDFFTDLSEGKLEDWSIADAFFIASGIRTPKDLKRANKWLDHQVKRAEEDLKSYTSTRERSDQLLRWLHKKLFSKYRASSTDAVEIIRSGRYNCLSSCILYGIIGYRLGLTVKGITVDKHAFCRVYQSRRKRKGWDVETTNALGFNPGRTVQIANAVVSVPRHRYRNRKEIGLREMIGLIYTNHMGLSDAFPTIKDRLLAYQKAILFFPNDKLIQYNVLVAHTQVIANAIDRRSWKKAWIYAEQLKGYDLKNRYWSDMVSRIINSHIDDLVINRKSYSKAIETLDDYRDKGVGLHPLVERFLKGKLYGIIAQQYLRRDQIQAALKEYKQALAIGGGAYKERGRKKRRKKKRGSSSIKLDRSLLRVQKNNYFVVIKNCIIGLLQEQNWQDAQTFVTLALEAHPKDSELRRYKRTIQEASRESAEIEAYNEVVERVQEQSWERAERSLKSAEEDFPRSKRIRQLKRQVEPVLFAIKITEHAQKGRMRRARQSLRKALKIYPQDQQLRYLRDQLSSSR